MTANYTRHPEPRRTLSFNANGGWNRFDSSGQVPLDEILAGRLDRFGFVDPTDGGHMRAGTIAANYRQENSRGGVLHLNGFAGRSLLDLYSNFTFFLKNPAGGDAFQQHDSRLQQGANAQWVRPHRLGSVQGLLSVGANLHAHQIHVALYPRAGRQPLGVTTWPLRRSCPKR